MACGKVCKVKEVGLRRLPPDKGGKPSKSEIYHDGMWQETTGITTELFVRIQNFEGDYDKARDLKINVVPVDCETCCDKCRCVGIVYGKEIDCGGWSHTFYDPDPLASPPAEGSRRDTVYYAKRVIRIGEGVCDEKPATLAFDVRLVDEEGRPVSLG